MHRFFLPEQTDTGDLTLSGAEAHHAARVLRVQQQERVMVLDGKGGERLCEVTHVKGDNIGLHIVEERHVPPLPFQITLLQAIPKGKLFEAIVQKATELGVSRLVPLLSERVIVQLDDHNRVAKAERWQHVAIEAIKQCGAPWLPNVEPPQTIDEILRQKRTCDLALIGALDGSAQHPRIHLREFEQDHGRKPATVCVWIGPEGDFTPAELETIRSAGALPITLGPLVLRTETAAIYCLSFLNYELQAP